jgi:glutamyl-tRNA synthetase
MKMEDGNKRKLSKRKDPELSLDYYRSEGSTRKRYGNIS